MPQQVSATFRFRVCEHVAFCDSAGSVHERKCLFIPQTRATQDNRRPRRARKKQAGNAQPPRSSHAWHSILILPREKLAGVAEAVLLQTPDVNALAVVVAVVVAAGYPALALNVCQLDDLPEAAPLHRVCHRRRRLRRNPLFRPWPRGRRTDLEEGRHVEHGEFLAPNPLRLEGKRIREVVCVVVPALALCLTRPRLDCRPALRCMRVAYPPAGSECCVRAREAAGLEQKMVASGQAGPPACAELAREDTRADGQETMLVPRADGPPLPGGRQRAQRQATALAASTRGCPWSAGPGAACERARRAPGCQAPTTQAAARSAACARSAAAETGRRGARAARPRRAGAGATRAPPRPAPLPPPRRLRRRHGRHRRRWLRRVRLRSRPCAPAVHRLPPPCPTECKRCFLDLPRLTSVGPCANRCF